MAPRSVVLTVWLVGGFCHALCQSGASSAPTPDPSVYEDFFREVVIDFVQAGSVALPRIETTIGLRDDQAAWLRRSASDCLTELQLVDEQIKRLTFDSRVQSIQYGEPAAWVTQRLADLNHKRDQVLVDHIERLRLLLGDASFTMLDTFVRKQSWSPLWRSIKDALRGPHGKEYFETGLKDAMLPALIGTVVSSNPTAHPKQFLIAMDGDTPEVKLRLDGPLEKPLPPGTPVIFEGVAREFTIEPFMVTFDVTAVNRATVEHKESEQSVPRNSK